MKERSYIILTAILGFLAGVLLTLVFVYFTQGTRHRAGQYRIDSDAGVTSSLLTDIAQETAGALKRGDYEALSELVHPDYGVMFSPYATVNLNTNLRFTPEEVADFSDNTQKLTWGLSADGSMPISLTVAGYMEKYVFDRDYTKCPVIGLNYTVRTGNARENVTESFPGAQFADLCYPGTAENEYSDWTILRLVFEEYKGELKLTAVIHSESTL